VHDNEIDDIVDNVGGDGGEITAEGVEVAAVGGSGPFEMTG
jgi:hypothetical protein